MTIKDIARLAGVSVSTVSRVLNNHPDVSEPVREKVMTVVAEQHYVPNNSARDLVRSPSETIGVVVRGAENPFFTSVIRAIEQEVDDSRYTMVLHQIREDADELAAGAALAASKKLKGLIFLGGTFDYTREQVASLCVPFVCCSFANDFGDLDPQDFSSVSIDDEAEAKKAVSLLTARGHRRIAVLLDSVSDRSISQLRYRGYLAALTEAGIEADPELVEEIVRYDMAAAYAGVENLLKRGISFTAIFAIADSMGIAAIKALHDNGLRVPKDCSVIAIDGIEISEYTIPTLTTLKQPRARLGTEAVRALLSVLDGKGAHCHLRLETTLREGGTLA